ncbi:MAG: hypothetical protein N3C62_05950 [Synergistetes bacterium]|nr:hypothetical protein [Synergistota bacterium]MCX8128260.1 hypothetical protein [Synergistota bacterium]MDW8192707.1 hypothetical protein [Synergistota bacterium]
MKVGVLDIGSNSLRGLWGDIDENLIFRKMGERLITTRLGEGIYLSKKLKEEAIDRTLVGLKKIYNELKDNSINEIYAFATSAVREASDRDHFLDLIQERVGLSVEILTGEEEAFQNLLGVEVGLGIRDDYLLFDIGGGSTEIVLKAGGYKLFRTFPIGALKLKDISFNSVGEIISFLENYWQEEAFSIKLNSCRAKTFVGVGGTISALALLKEKAAFYDMKLVHGKKLDMNWLYSILVSLSKLPSREIDSLFIFDPGRSYIILEGSLILFSLMSFFAISEIIVSETNLLWGGLVKKWGVKSFVF